MKPAIGVNLEGLSYYCRMPLYADAMFSAQAFYQGADALGNPTKSGEQVLVVSNATPGYAGTYKFIANGFRQITPKAIASYAVVSNAAFANGQSTADVSITAAQLQQLPQISLEFDEAPASAGQSAWDGTNIQLWRPGATVGDLFYAPFVLALKTLNVGCIRFMDALATNNSALSDWSQRPVPGQRNYTTNGIPLEHAVSLCKAVGCDGWLHLPYGIAVSPNGINQFAQWLAANVPIGSPQSLYVEVSNEVWNTMFGQWKQNQAAAAANAAIKYDGMGDPNILGWRQTAWLGVQLSKAIAAAYGVTNWRQTPIRPVLAMQWGNTQVGTYTYKYLTDQFGPTGPATFFYGSAIAPYATVGAMTSDTPADEVAALKVGNANDPNTLQYHAWAKQYGLHSLAYEFGFDFGQNPANASIRAQAQSLPALADAMHAYLSNWAQGGGELANWYNYTYASGNSGNWGLLEDFFTPNTVKMQELARSALLMWWDDPPIPLPVAASPAPAPVQTPPLFSGSFSLDPTGKKYVVSVTAV